MRLTNVDFYYFSGNTLIVVREMARTLAERGIEVELHKIEKSDPGKVDLNKTIGLAFPVAAQSTFPFVWDFIEKMPAAEGTEVFMVDTLAAFSGGLVGPLRKILQAKGYIPIGAKEIKMPSNFYPKKISSEKDEEKIAKGLQTARNYALALVQGTAAWGKIAIFSDLIFTLSRSRKVWKFMSNLGKRIALDKEKCTQCQSCVKLCPTGNIAMDDYPLFSSKCQQCMRCLSFCPEAAISIPEKHYEVYRAVSLSEMMGEK